MPEMHFRIRWPDGSRETCYSPSTIVRTYLQEGRTYTLADFIALSRTALVAASERVREIYGAPCSRAQGQIARLEAKGRTFAADADVTVESLAMSASLQD